MTPSADEQGGAFYAETYDESVPDWPGELVFYREMAAQAIRLAEDGAEVVGLGLSPKMLAVARPGAAAA